MSSKTVETRKEDSEKYLKIAQKLHQQGNLKKALRAYNAALQTTTDLETAVSIRYKIAEVEEMLSFVSSVSEEKKQKNDQPLTGNLKENSKDLLDNHGKKFAVAGLGLSIVLLGFLSWGPIMGLFQASSPQETAQNEEPQEKVPKTENNNVNSEVFGRSGKDGSSVLEIVEADSYSIITIPAELMAPYPQRFIGSSMVELHQKPGEKAPVQSRLKRNTRVYLKDKTPNNRWLYIEAIRGPQKGWVQAQQLSDSRVLTYAERDAEIKAEMGDKYWELEIQGQSMPYNYFLKVNAPTAKEAEQGLVKAFSYYAKKQLVDMHNWRSHQKVETFEVSSQASYSPGAVEVHFNLISLSETGYRQQAGTKTIKITQGRDKRYYLRMPLEGI